MRTFKDFFETWKFREEPKYHVNSYGAEKEGGGGGGGEGVGV